jgi:putative membrane-bound dehydrogenase-like protein
MNLKHLIVCCLLFAGAAASAKEPAARGPLSPAEEAATFRLADEQLTVELVAAEPQVDSPAAVAWDADGRMYVAEMSDYPTGPGTGRIRLLVDRDGDGRYETSTIFADRLNFPNSVLCCRGGVFATAAPDLWYLKDTDGDGRADERRIVWTGFGEGNQQLRVNGLTWGLDNWIYGANGRSNGEIRRPGAEETVSIRTRDFRFSPDGEHFEAITGQSQFGQTRDDWGRRFLSWNTIPIRHALLDPATLAAHPRLIPQAVRDIADPVDRGRVFPISPRPQTFNREATDYYNALCGLSIYRGNAFVGESLTNLVHRRVLSADGPTFVSRRGEESREFLASSDPWFHPANTATGPDGALYVVDFYRRWVEHPQFVSPSLRGGVDWREGAGHGRIWRIRRRDQAGERPKTPRLSEAGVVDLVGELAQANGWRRDTAQRLLVERGDPAAIPLLRETARNKEPPVARAHALWTLQSLGGLDEGTLLAALADPVPEVREQALQLAAQRSSPSAELTAAVRDLVDDASVAVRFRLALSLDSLDDGEKQALWLKLAQQPDATPWLLLAVSAALDERSARPFVERLVSDDARWLKAPTPEQAAFLKQATALLRDDEHVVELFAFLQSCRPAQIGPGQLAILAGLTQASLADNRSLRQWLAENKQGRSAAAQTLRSIIDVARRVAADEQAAVSQRNDALSAIGLDQPERAAPLLLSLLDAKQPQEVQSAAAAVLCAVADAEMGRQMFAAWHTYTAATRRAVAEAALRHPSTARAAVEAIERGDVLAIELDSSARKALGSLADKALRERAAKALCAAAPADRRAVLAQYQPALERSGDRQRGADLFRQHCLACHNVQGLGHRVGADLSGIGGRPKPTLLEDVLDPNRRISADYLAYTLVTNDGQVLVGLLAAESGEAVTLRRAEGVEETVPRSRIDELRASGQSLMPEGFEQKLGVRDMADLLEFLARPERKLVEP